MNVTQPFFSLTSLKMTHKLYCTHITKSDTRCVALTLLNMTHTLYCPHFTECDTHFVLPSLYRMWHTLCIALTLQNVTHFVLPSLYRMWYTLCIAFTLQNVTHTLYCLHFTECDTYLLLPSPTSILVILLARVLEEELECFLSKLPTGVSDLELPGTLNIKKSKI